MTTDASSKWTPEQWAAWRANNMRLIRDGWTLSTVQTLDGTVEEWAEKNGVRFRRDPQWDRDEDGNYVYGALTP